VFDVAGHIFINSVRMSTAIFRGQLMRWLGHLALTKMSSDSFFTEWYIWGGDGKKD
jgi:hypothetical protein